MFWEYDEITCRRLNFHFANVYSIVRLSSLVHAIIHYVVHLILIYFPVYILADRRRVSVRRQI